MPHSMTSPASSSVRKNFCSARFFKCFTKHARSRPQPLRQHKEYSWWGEETFNAFFCCLYERERLFPASHTRPAIPANFAATQRALSAMFVFVGRTESPRQLGHKRCPCGIGAATRRAETMLARERRRRRHDVTADGTLEGVVFLEEMTRGVCTPS